MKNTIKIWPIILFSSFLISVYVILFILPNHIENFALIPEKISQGELWRFGTYQFAHLNFEHLLKNLIGLSIITAGIIGLKTKFSEFTSIYLIAGFLAVLPLWFILQFTALGASVAIYSVFGLIAIEAKKYEIKTAHILTLIIAAIFIETALSNNSTVLLSSLSHLSGLIFGVFALIFANKVHKIWDKRKIYCLRSA